jgi:hypothetical protein
MRRPEIKAVYERVKAKFGKRLEPVSVSANHPEIFKAYTSTKAPNVGWRQRREWISRSRNSAALKSQQSSGVLFVLTLGQHKLEQPNSGHHGGTNASVV